jgi:hypothetical protein
MPASCKWLEKAKVAFIEALGCEHPETRMRFYDGTPALK